jgi:hypothetical protein
VVVAVLSFRECSSFRSNLKRVTYSTSYRFAYAYIFCFVQFTAGVQEVIWQGGGSEPAGEYKFFYGKGNENHELGAGFLCA